MRRRTAIRVGAVVTALALTLGMATAFAATTVTVDGQALSGGKAVWDVSNPYDYGSGGAPCSTTTGGFTPATDGTYQATGGDATDAFDGGLYLNVGGTIFSDKDLNGTLSGQQLTVGPTKMSGLAVSRIERALSTSPTLRSLVRFTNASANSITVTVLWDSAMGSDGSAATRSSSAAPFDTMTAADRWIVASDDASSPSDPPVTWVFYGTGRPLVKVGAVRQAPEAMPTTDNDCVVVSYKIKVPAHTTRYLMFFTEMHDPANQSSAFNGALKFNNVRVGTPLMTGIAQSTASKILNWDF